MDAENPAIWQEDVRGSYPDPAVIALPGSERLQGWRRRTSPPPPLSHLTGAVPIGFGDGTADAEMPASGWLASSTGVISGGTLAIVADIAFGCSIETQLPAATTYTTAELSMSFLRPARPGIMLTAHGQAIHVGRSVALSEVFVLDRDSERLIAHGTSRLSVFPPLSDPPAKAYVASIGTMNVTASIRIVCMKVTIVGSAPLISSLSIVIWDKPPGVVPMTALGALMPVSLEAR